jgi:uncharacterized protein YwqG
MSGGHDRRAFFRELLRGASRAAGEVQSLRGAAGESSNELLGRGAVDEPDPIRVETVPALPAARLASPDELRVLCIELGREPWADEAVALARTSVRLTPGGGGRSRLGGLPEVPPDFAWPVWQGQELALVAQLRLDELPAGPLPAAGTLLVFFALDPFPTGVQATDAGACHVLLVADGPTEPVERDGALPEVPVEPSAELMLPLEPVSFVLDSWEHEAWTQLRERLAVAQGVELEDRADDYHALHRLLGYPDTLAEGMELDAELVSSGIDVDPYRHPFADGVVPAAADWRLLFQLSSDEELAVALGYFERLYVWIREDDLRAGRFDDVRAFVR